MLFLRSIKQLLERNKLVTLFVKSLEQFSQPNAIFRDFCDDLQLRKLMTEPRKNAAQIKQLYTAMYNELLNADRTESQEDLYSGTSVPSVLGGCCLEMCAHNNR